ncbi:hypothetical protein [Biomaibacter acetigenes]|nr:hypothetical protein [Biomaibacter acetigenes]
MKRILLLILSCAVFFNVLSVNVNNKTWPNQFEEKIIEVITLDDAEWP